MKYLVLADVHANQPALQAVLEAESDWDKLLFLGDAVDGGPHPEEAVGMLSELSGTFLMGNHDHKVLDQPDDPDVAGMADFGQWSKAQLSDESLGFLRELEAEQRCETPAFDLRLHHGDFTFDREIEGWSGRLWPDTDRAVYAALADRYAEPVVVLAHSHVQFDKRVEGTRFVNPGSVGQNRLGTVAGCYAVLEDGEFDLRAAEYDTDPVLESMDELPLDEEYLEARKRVYREGRLPEPSMRDYDPLIAAGYR